MNENNNAKGKSTMSNISKEDLEAIKRVIQNMRMEEEGKADLFSVTSVNSEPFFQAALVHQPDVVVEELYLSPSEPASAYLSSSTS